MTNECREVTTSVAETAANVPRCRRRPGVGNSPNRLYLSYENYIHSNLNNKGRKKEIFIKMLHGLHGDF